MTELASRYKYFAVTIIVVALIVYGFFWKAARDEVFFLCGNFSSDVDQIDVIRQLETANLSNHLTSNNEDGIAIVFSSNVNFSMYKCIIKIDNTGKVSDALFL
jgi:flagellar biosynthesis/type III secretory pathway M-ring protein FliF/YscJ